MTDLVKRFLNVTQKIQEAALAFGCAPSSIQLLAVSKTVQAAQVEALWNMGQRAFGENYVQEAIVKIEALKNLRATANPIEWHLIGPLQSNKTAVVAAHFDWVQTIDRLKIAQRLSDQRPAHLPPLNVCIQVNVDSGKNKSGIDIKNEEGLDSLLALARQIKFLPNLTLRGLLAIPEPQPNAAKQQTVFNNVRVAFDFLKTQLQTADLLDTVSMGMSTDLEAAIAAGSTMVRVGSAIFGERFKNS